VHGLVDAALLGDEPEVDGPERGQHAAADAGLLLDLADGRLLRGLAALDVALGQRPHQAPAAVVAGDERRPRLTRAPVDHEAARAGLVDASQAGRGARRGGSTARGRGRARGGGGGAPLPLRPRRRTRKGGAGHTGRIAAPPDA
jgi:hypothetical protein